jgi:lycopene cyclase domain-containing protein
MSVFFLTWDIFFTRMGIWGFNDRYITGLKFSGLPIEEYLFFLLIGFCCLFVYESMNHLIKISWKESISKNIFIGIAFINILIAVFNYSKWYTVSALGLNGVFIVLIISFAPWFSWNKFLLGYLISFVPFTLVNGILTGGFTPEPVVWYNDEENLKIRLGTIPIEDSQYMMLMMSMSIAIYEWCRKARNKINPEIKDF